MPKRIESLEDFRNVKIPEIFREIDESISLEKFTRGMEFLSQNILPKTKPVSDKKVGDSKNVKK